MIKAIRQVHLCLGIFFAPTIVFFSVTGAFQTFGLHESGPGDAFQTPDWLAAAAEVHKNQSFKLAQDEVAPKVEPVSVEKTSTDITEIQQPKTTRAKPKKHTSQILKWLVLLMSIGLTASVFSGIYMAFTYKRERKLVWGLLVAGTILPIAALFL